MYCKLHVICRAEVVGCLVNTVLRSTNCTLASCFLGERFQGVLGEDLVIKGECLGDVGCSLGDQGGMVRGCWMQLR